MAFKMNYAQGEFPFKKNEEKKLNKVLEPTIIIPKKTVSKVHRSDKSIQEEQFEKRIKG
tara:strand:- start:499 stop:675 length:177 start_codon:yes stop_codon:yes gene_type:complete